jgi:hypothetical protein
MNTEREGLTFKTSFCEQYEQLLLESRDALEIWSNRQSEILQLGLHGKEVGDQLMRLQSNFAKAYARLQRHIRNCPACEFVNKLAQQNTSISHISEPSSRPA